ncbi:ribonuclease III [Paludicola sp. MB14-C6]|uniref:ribonuclease III n=1 Tax=Paludihabitans sp. MB14-C6 TaxID=3070656 RepID=UPI0027DC97C8|nr:ribonuclease III [Paludicola sp. MB14-C6]WMJ23685.1 ribonuclease III [Paludicola sp. MB14-C6]
MENLEVLLGYQYKNNSLLKVALTHSSFANEGKKGGKNNERLEFLGDSVLSIIVAEHLFNHYKHLPEGELTKYRAALVCEKSLYQFALQINLGEYLLLGKGEENTGGRTRPSILADAFEAIIASIYLDGGLEQARKFVLRFIPETIDTNKVSVLSDYKTALQEIIQKNKEEKIEYVLIKELGPDHNKLFVVEVHLNSNVIGVGKGRSKKQAEQFAAKEALELMGYET